MMIVDDCEAKRAQAFVQTIASPEFTKKIYVLASHAHGDHFDPAILDWRNHKQIQYIFSKDIQSAKQIQEGMATFIDKGETYEDEYIRIKAYGSTDIGVSFYIEAEGKTLFHAGDLNNWHWKEEYSAEQAAQCEQAYLTELNDIAKDITTVDLLMFPTDPRLGKDYLLGAKQFMQAVSVRTFAPMHFWNHFDKAMAFSGYVQEKGVGFLNIQRVGDVFEF